MKETMKNSQRGFTLVELSIVLVIIGLLIGGILAGQALIHSAKLRSVYSDIDKYQSALNLFKQKYDALPGDIKYAVRLWGAAAGGTNDGLDSDCVDLDYTSPSVGKETCNGDGDKAIEHPNGEMMRFWQHLSNAGLIDGHYTGVSATGASNRAHQGGLNCPSGSLPRTAFSIYFIETDAAYRFPGDYRHTFLFGKDRTDWETISPVFSAQDALAIDTKLDDGLPGKGIIRPRNRELPGGHRWCTTSSDPDTSLYEVEYNDRTCALHIITGM